MQVLGIGTASWIVISTKKGSELRQDLKRKSLRSYMIKLQNMTKEDVETIS
ncbi:MAG: YtxH domain-containing protein [Thomasclavelia sp.]